MKKITNKWPGGFKTVFDDCNRTSFRVCTELVHKRSFETGPLRVKSIRAGMLYSLISYCHHYLIGTCMASESHTSKTRNNIIYTFFLRCFFLTNIHSTLQRKVLIMPQVCDVSSSLKFFSDENKLYNDLTSFLSKPYDYGFECI